MLHSDPGPPALQSPLDAAPLSTLLAWAHVLVHHMGGGGGGGLGGGGGGGEGMCGGGGEGRGGGQRKPV